MADLRSLRDRLLAVPDLAAAVPRLPSDVLHRAIDACGLEDAGDLIALATPEQIGRVLDVDVWRARTPSADETLDAERFGLWLRVLTEAGAAAAARTLAALDVELVTAGLARHVAVFDRAAVSSYETLDGARIDGRAFSGSVVEIGGYVVQARRTSVWDAIVELLAALDADHPTQFARVMRASVGLSHGPREENGFHDLLDDDEQDMFDLAAERETRRDAQGYVSAAQARAFVESARRLSFDGPPPRTDPIARAYFRAMEPEPAIAEATSSEASGAADAEPPGASTALSDVMEILREGGALRAEPRGLLPPADAGPARLADVRAHLARHPERTAELAFLANVTMAGGAIQGQPFTAPQSRDAALALCNLGLVRWPEGWPDRDLVTAFQVGLATLHREACTRAAERLLDAIGALRCTDRDVQLELFALQRELRRGLAEGKPWMARQALEVLVMIDAATWAALAALIDEWPVLHAAVRALHDRRTTIAAADFEFISDEAQLASVREFLDALPGQLS